MSPNLRAFLGGVAFVVLLALGLERAQAAEVFVFKCNGAATIEAATSGNEFGACEPGQGMWTAFEIAEPFDVSSLDATRLRDAFAAGFVVLATGLLVVFPIRLIIRKVKSS